MRTDYRLLKRLGNNVLIAGIKITRNLAEAQLNQGSKFQGLRESGLAGISTLGRVQAAAFNVTEQRTLTNKFHPA